MFKHLSEILREFSTPQRILALLLLLTTIIMIILGPPLINALTKDTADLLAEIRDYRTEIRVLRNEVYDLNTELRQSQKDCTDMIIAREREIMEYISDLEARIRQSIRQSTPIAVIPDYLRSGDTIQYVPQAREQIILDEQQTEMILEGLKDIRNKINGKD